MLASWLGGARHGRLGQRLHQVAHEEVLVGPASVDGAPGDVGILDDVLHIVAAILLAVYRSPVLWVLPILSAIGAIELARAAAHGLADAGVTVSNLSSAILVVLGWTAFWSRTPRPGRVEAEALAT
jgi:uncharacterized membrane protein YdfJ with MMPL/SSD domain